MRWKPSQKTKWKVASHFRGTVENNFLGAVFDMSVDGVAFVWISTIWRVLLIHRHIPHPFALLTVASGVGIGLIFSYDPSLGSKPFSSRQEIAAMGPTNDFAGSANGKGATRERSGLNRL